MLCIKAIVCTMHTVCVWSGTWIIIDGNTIFVIILIILIVVVSLLLSHSLFLCHSSPFRMHYLMAFTTMSISLWLWYGVCILHSGTHSCQLQFDVLGPIRRISEYQREHNEASRDIGKYISNPINAYLLTKRLTSDWKAVEQVMAHDVSSRK